AGHHEPGGQGQAEPPERFVDRERGHVRGGVLKPVGDVFHPPTARPTASTHRRYFDIDFGLSRSPSITSLKAAGMAPRNLNSVITSSPSSGGPSAGRTGSTPIPGAPWAARSNVTRIGPSWHVPTSATRS